LLLDFDGWKRAFNPALRVVGYSAAIYLIITVITILPLYFMQAPAKIYTFFTALNTLIFFFAIILSFFKVLDEGKAKPVTNVASDSIKLM